MPFEPYIFDYIGLNKNKRSEDFYSLPHEIYKNNKIDKGEIMNLS